MDDVRGALTVSTGPIIMIVPFVRTETDVNIVGEAFYAPFIGDDGIIGFAVMCTFLPVYLSMHIRPYVCVPVRLGIRCLKLINF